MKKEIWKDIPGLEGLYQASSLGNIRSMNRFVRSCYGSFASVKSKVLIPATDMGGYKRISISNNGLRRNVYVHDLVCLAFYGQKQNGLECLHINGNPGDNRACNLKWGTHKENQGDPIRLSRLRDAWDSGRFDSIKKSVGQYSLNGMLVNSFCSISEASRATKIHAFTICSVCRGKRKTAGGYIWKYTNKNE